MWSSLNFAADLLWVSLTENSEGFPLLCSVGGTLACNLFMHPMMSKG